MKLRTHISKQTGSWVPAVEIHSHLVTAINHDAMVAHALVMAMKQLYESKDPTYFDVSIDAIYDLADELMRELGYDDG